MAQGVAAGARLPRLPQLDGLRAVAVALVIGAHLGFTISMSLTTRRWLAPLIGGDGVTLFFVLSGYLITSLLVREQIRTGSIRLRSFAARRALRIVPAFTAYMGLTVVLVAVGALHISWLHVGLAAAYLWDYATATVPWFGHTWSLAVEEQFYLLWPLTLLLLRTRWALRLALAVVIAEPLIRWASVRAFPADTDRLGFMAHDHVDALLAGAALAMAPAVAPDGYRRLTDAVLRWRVDVFAIGLYFVAAPYLALPGWRDFDLYGYRSVLAISGMLVVHGLVERPRGTSARVLSHPVPRHIGVVSYSLYLWQQPWLLPTVSLSPVVRVAGALVSAEASYWLVERPFLRLKSRLRSPGAEPEARSGSVPAAASVAPGVAPVSRP
jgi:peptidoglycan/LPS O-acetylase OafA/YrhL